jgi:hypothetical protein
MARNLCEHPLQRRAISRPRESRRADLNVGFDAGRAAATGRFLQSARQLSARTRRDLSAAAAATGSGRPGSFRLHEGVRHPQVRKGPKKVSKPQRIRAASAAPSFCFSHAQWSGREDSNFRPPAPHAGALPGCATPRPNLRLYRGPWPTTSAAARGFLPAPAGCRPAPACSRARSSPPWRCWSAPARRRAARRLRSRGDGARR